MLPRPKGFPIPKTVKKADDEAEGNESSKKSDHETLLTNDPSDVSNYL